MASNEVYRYESSDVESHDLKRQEEKSFKITEQKSSILITKK